MNADHSIACGVFTNDDGRCTCKEDQGFVHRDDRRLHGLCLYCGVPTRRADVCGHCSDLPVRDPLVSKARQPLSEQERRAAAG